MKTSRVGMVCSVSLCFLSAALAADEPRDVSRIVVSGNEAIAASDIVQCISHCPTVLAAAELHHSEDETKHAIELAIREGYKNAGFHQSRVEVERSADTWKASIVEGPRVLKGRMRIEGTPETVEWLHSALSKSQADSKKSFWKSDIPWNGEPGLWPDQESLLNDCLKTLGIHPRFISRRIQAENGADASGPTAVLVLTVPASVKPTRLESIQCEAADRELITAKLAKQGISIGSQLDPHALADMEQKLLATCQFDMVTAKVEMGHGLGDVALNIQASRSQPSSSDGALARQKVLSFGQSLKQLTSDRSGVHLTMTMQAAQADIWVFEKSFAVELANTGKPVAQFINNANTDLAAIETRDGVRYVVGIPNLTFRFGVNAEKPGSKKVACQFGADFASSDNNALWNRFELDRAALCLLFPLAESNCSEVPDGWLINSPRARLELARDGKFKSLSIKSEDQPDSVWLLESVASMPDSLREKEGRSDDRLAFTLPRTVATAATNDKSKFYVMRSKSEFTSNWTFWLVDETLKYGPDSAVVGLARAFSISTTGDKVGVRTACDRWLAKHKPGPFSLMAIAYCYANAGDAEPAAAYADRAMQTLASGQGMESDLDSLFVEQSLVGEAVRKVNARDLHTLVSQIALAVGAGDEFTNFLKFTQPSAEEPVDQWKFVVQRIVPFTLTTPLQSLATQIRSQTTRTAAGPSKAEPK